MKMITHQTIGMDLPASLRAGLAENLQEALSIDSRRKKLLPAGRLDSEDGRGRLSIRF
jgi:hypothetical protein